MKHFIHQKERAPQGQSIRFLLPEYGKKKLTAYADSLRDLAHNFSTETNELVTADRREIFLRQSLGENRILVAKQLEETARVLRALATEAYQSSYALEKAKKQIEKVLRANDLEVKEIYAIENKNARMEIGITLRAMEKDCYCAAELAEFLSALCERDMRLLDESVSYIYNEYVTVSFRECARFYVRSGVARATKEGETISGDNYSLGERSCCSYLAVISDGMGSGAIACEDSESIVELCEKFLELDYEPESAAHILNDLLLSRAGGLRSATLDMCEINLYTGESVFLKMGAAASFVKRGQEVRKISNHALPLGVFGNMAFERQEVCLKDKDYLILVSDGIVDSLPEIEGERILERAIERMAVGGPSEMANLILGLAIQKSAGVIRDDMTVLVLALVEE